MIDKVFIDEAKALVERSSANKDLDYFCTSRDIYQGRLETYIARTERYFESAVIGEIGNNTFDHNWDFDKDHVRGAFFNYEYADNCVIMADYGKGLAASLSKVVDVKNDVEALKIGFKNHISARAPEQRGNGLKFVFDNVILKGWDLYFQSGNGCCIIENGSARFEETADSVIGCFAILKY